MSSELNKAVAHGYFDAYSTGDIEAVMEFVGSNYVLHLGGDGNSMNSVQHMQNPSFAEESLQFRKRGQQRDTVVDSADV